MIKMGGSTTSKGVVMATTASFCLTLSRGSKLWAHCLEGDHGITGSKYVSGNRHVKSVNRSKM